MSALLEEEPRAAAAPALRVVNVGVLGLGQVGQAVARLAPEARLRHAGYRVRIAGALVRDISKPRRCVRPTRITTNPSAFLRGHYDVVVEALGTVEPARSIVSRLLGRGIPVVTANKALVAACGPELSALAARRGTVLRYEASALAGVPFLGALSARPLVSDVSRFTAIVNGTSNYILSRLDTGEVDFDAALAEAQARGLTEPDPSRDLDGLDAADKLSLLATLFGWGSVPPFRLEVQGLRGITAADLAVARRLDSTIKPVVCGTAGPSGISAFVAPALISARHPLAALDGTLTGISLSGRYVSDLFFSGPGAGPDVTAATILDDVVEAVATSRKAARATPARPARHALLTPPPATRWLVRARFPGLVPDAASTAGLFTSRHLPVHHVSETIGPHRWVLLDPAPRPLVDETLRRITETHCIELFSLRAL